MERRSFLAGLLLAPWAAIVAAGALLQACGSDATPLAICDGVTPLGMDGGHTHPLCVPQALLDAPADSTLNLGTAAGHAHTITLTAGQIAAIAAGTPGVVDPTNADGTGHIHTVTFT